MITTLTIQKIAENCGNRLLVTGSINNRKGTESTLISQRWHATDYLSYYIVSEWGPLPTTGVV
jgi:hypothetical protein